MACARLSDRCAAATAMAQVSAPKVSSAAITVKLGVGASQWLLRYRPCTRSRASSGIGQSDQSKKTRSKTAYVLGRVRSTTKPGLTAQLRETRIGLSNAGLTLT